MCRYRLSVAVAVALVAALALPSPIQGYGDDLVCYFSSWARWRPGNGMFDVEDVDPFLCTHVVFSFTGLSNVTWEMEVLDPWNELCPDEDGGHYCAFDRFVKLKEKNPKLKTLLAVGGWREGSEDYSVMAADPYKRSIFINSAIARITKHGFDGLDMDWEYPGSRGGAPEDKENFVTLMQEIRRSFDQFEPPLLLSSAVAAGKSIIDEAYGVSQLVPLMDKWHVMAYDYHGAWENVTHHNTPLCGYYLDEEEFLTFNVRFTVQYYLDLGVPKDKMVMGIATYGRCWTLDDINDHGMLAPAHAPGPAGPYIRIPGTLGFNEICERLKDSGNDCKVVHDPNLYEPYFYCTYDKIWCGYDDADSVYLKARYARNLGLAGVMVWQIDTDDFKPLCQQEKFHLINQMKRAIQKPAGGDELVCPDFGTVTEASSTTEITSSTIELLTTTTTEPSTPEPTTTTILTTTSTTTTTIDPGSTTTHNPSLRPDCTGLPDGTTFPHSDCNKYWECISEVGILELCAPGTVWDQDLNLCNWEEDVDTSNCHQWICSVDNTYYPHPDCDKYYWCSQGSPVLQQCASGTFWSQEATDCVNPSDIDTSTCNIP
uniref:Chitinase 4 n=1 Tax=Scylla paramamosain TaxID=85552 RepID=A0A2U9QGJ4_SCYPA|nr:chitinase 4 [Scylla paramamosain]